jgi:hypothetical protein
VSWRTVAGWSAVRYLQRMGYELGVRRSELSRAGQRLRTETARVRGRVSLWIVTTLVACSHDETPHQDSDRNDGTVSGFGSTSAPVGGSNSAGGQGGDTSTSAGGGHGGTLSSGLSSAGTSTSSGGDGGQQEPATGACPLSLPQPASSCENESLRCTFGEAGDFACRDAATCTQGQWNVVPSSCEKTACPADTAQRSPCTMLREQCTTTAGDECACVELTPGNAQWFCDLVENAQRNPDCPPLPPNAGSSCEFKGTCTYTRCEVLDSTVRATCRNGSWLVEAGPCEVITD